MTGVGASFGEARVGGLAGITVGIPSLDSGAKGSGGYSGAGIGDQMLWRVNLAAIKCTVAFCSLGSTGGIEVEGRSRQTT